MASPSMIPLATITMDTNTQSSIVFDSIPSGYRHLVMRGNMLRTTTTSGILVRYNDNAENIYDLSALGANNSASTLTVNETATTGQAFYWVQPGPTEPTPFEITFLDYAQTDKNKTSIIRVGKQTNAVLGTIQVWRKTDAITKINIYSAGSAYDIGTTISLYGIG